MVDTDFTVLLFYILLFYDFLFPPSPVTFLSLF